MNKAVICVGCALFLGLSLLFDTQCEAATLKEREQAKLDIDNAVKMWTKILIFCFLCAKKYIHMGLAIGIKPL